jgi:permuted papain-like amidase YaeF/Yiix C92 family enzyme
MRTDARHRIRCLAGIAVFFALLGCTPSGGYEPRDGDIVFHTSRSSQSLAIQLATKSPYSHMGIVYLRDDEPFVFEAVQPVKLTPLDDWIERGERERFVVKRLRDSETRLTAQALRSMRAVGEQLAGKDYDPYFEWSDDRMYCSELVWKVFERGAGIELGELQTIAAFDLSHPAVQAKVRERYGDHVPLDEVVVSPAAIFDAPDLETVYEK